MGKNRPRRPCEQVKPDGKPCRTNAATGGRYCFFDDPEMAEERAAASRAGGKERSRKVVVLPPDTPERPIKNAADVVELMSVTINRVVRGELDPKIANSVGFLAGVTLKAFELGLEEGVPFVNVVAQERQTDESRFLAETEDGSSEFEEPQGSEDEK